MHWDHCRACGKLAKIGSRRFAWCSSCWKRIPEPLREEVARFLDEAPPPTSLAFSLLARVDAVVGLAPPTPR
jgi:hypothetical protein